jgi:hypothetical protein
MGTKLMHPSLWMLTFIRWHTRCNTKLHDDNDNNHYEMLVVLNYDIRAVRPKYQQHSCIFPNPFVLFARSLVQSAHCMTFPSNFKSTNSIFCVKFTLHIREEEYLFMKLKSSKKCKETRTPVLKVNTMPDKWLIQLYDVTFINFNKTFCEDWVNIQHWRNYLFSSWS